MGKGGLTQWMEEMNILSCGLRGRKGSPSSMGATPWGNSVENVAKAAEAAHAAELAQRAGDTTRALEMYRQALDLHPDAMAYLLGAGNVHLERGELLQAIALFERCARVRVTTQPSKQTDPALQEALARAAATIQDAAAAMKAAAEAASMDAAAEDGAAMAAREPAETLYTIAEAIEPVATLPADVTYDTMTLEDKVDALRTQCPSRSTGELRKVLADHHGDIHKAFAVVRKP